MTRFSEAANKKFKIIFIIDNLGSGGAQRNLLDYLAHKKNDHIQCSVISLTSHQAQYDRKISQYADIYFLQHTPCNVLTVLNFFIWKKIFDIQREIKPDVIHARLLGSLYFAGLMAILSRTPRFFYTIEASFRQIPKWTKIYQKIFTVRFEEIFTSYPDEYLSAGYPPEKMNNYEFLIKKDLSQDEKSESYAKNLRKSASFKLISIGRLHPDKGHQNALAVLKKLLQKNNKYQLVICGDGPYKKELEDLVQKWNLQHSVIFTGHLSNVDYVVQECDIYLHFTLNEPENLSCAKACLYGLPTIKYELNLKSHLQIIDGKHGYIIQKNDHDDAADKIIKIMNTPDIKLSFQKNTKELVKPWANEESFRKFYNDIYLQD